VGEIDIKETVSFVGVFAALQDPEFFASVRVDPEAGTIARGWTLEKTASVFLLDLHTLQLWIRRVDEHGEPDVTHIRRRRPRRCVLPKPF
jgi:hypothetical protein